MQIESKCFGGVREGKYFFPSGEVRDKNKGVVALKNEENLNV